MIGTFFEIRFVVNVENFAVSDNSVETTPSVLYNKTRRLPCVGLSSCGCLDVPLELLRRRWLAMLFTGTMGSAATEKYVTAAGP